MLQKLLLILHRHLLELLTMVHSNFRDTQILKVLILILKEKVEIMMPESKWLLLVVELDQMMEI